MRLVLTAALLVAVAVTVSSHPAAGRSSSARSAADGEGFSAATPSELRLRGTVDSLAADGARVAFGVCRFVGGTWQPGKTPRFFLASPASDVCTNPTGSPSCCGTFGPFAVAGDRVAFWRTEGGIGVYGSLYTVAVDNDYSLQGVVFPSRCCSGDPVGSLRWGDLVGGGSTIVYAHWDFCGTYTCGGGPVHVTDEDVRRVVGSCNPQAGFAGCPQVTDASQAEVPLAADSARIVLRRGDGSLELRTPAGNLLRTLRVPGGEPLDAALAGRILVVLVPGALRVFDALTGRAGRSWSIQRAPLGGVCIELPYQCPSPELELGGAARGLAAYVASGFVHVVRLADGTDVAVARGEHARLTSAGLFYAYAGAKPWLGRVRFVPRAILFHDVDLPGTPAPRSSRPELFAQTALQLLGTFPAGYAGSSVAAAGDVNGDGRPDVVVGAQSASPKGRTVVGSAFIVFGRRRTQAVELNRLGGRGIRIDASGTSTYAVSGVAGLGDVTGDHRGDVAVTEFPSTVWVVLGRRRAGEIDLASPGGAAVPIRGLTGATAAAAGDVNGDGSRDILVCCTANGDTAVVFGSRSFSAVDVNALGGRGFLVRGVAPGSIAGVGDTNGDGLADIALGEPYVSLKTWVVYGKRDTEAVDVRALGVAGFTITESAPPVAGYGPGVSLAGVHDVNGDHLADVAVGTANEGVAIVFGARNHDPVDVDALGRRGFFIRMRNDSTVPQVSWAGDLNRDGRSDVAVSSFPGFAVVYGRRQTNPVDVGTHFNGFTIAAPVTLTKAVGVGGENGDGEPDVLLASQFGGNGGPGSGTVYVFSRDVRPPRIHVAVVRDRVGVALRASCNEACTVSVPGSPRVFLVDPRRRALLRVRAQAAVVAVRAVDPAGNVTRTAVAVR